MLQPVADGCRPSRFRLSASLLLDAAHCCWLLSPLSRPLRTTRTPSVEAPPANFLALARRPKRLPGPLSLIFTTGPAILRYVLHSSTSTSTTRSPLLFFLPAHSRIPTNRSIDHHVGNKTLSRCRAVEGRSFLSSHSCSLDFCLVSTETNLPNPMPLSPSRDFLLGYVLPSLCAQPKKDFHASLMA